uniref:RNase NYN domain-containing protein n=1 Tax=Parascaris univalens TaxID=6257 RepID=A0A914ZZY2_PARUN
MQNASKEVPLTFVQPVYHKVLEKVGSLLSLYRLNSLGQTGGISCWSSSLMSTSFLE